MLARAGQPDAEQFLRAATKLKPTDKIEEGRARAWASLGHVLENAKPDEMCLGFLGLRSLRIDRAVVETYFVRDKACLELVPGFFESFFVRAKLA